jgi:hypothetical protein
MPKKKKKKDEWTIFVNSLLNRKRLNRKSTIPTTYLLALADKIHSINPTKVIVYNTLKEVYITAAENTYKRCLSDIKFFRDKQAKHIKDDWNAVKDQIDDLIHSPKQ